MRRLVTATLALLLAAPLAAQERGLVANMGACSSRAPRLWIAVDGASVSDCSSGGGASQVLCLCSGGAWAAVGGSLPQHLADYSPLRAPASCAICEEFTNGALAQTWAWVTRGLRPRRSSLTGRASTTLAPREDRTDSSLRRLAGPTSR